MKKNFIYALLGAIALTGAASLTACSSSDEIVDNPNYNPETNTVKATITLSINPNAGVNTRQSGATVQNTGFRGIGSILSLPSTGDISASTSTSSKLSWADIASGDITNGTKNYQLYANQNLVVGVDHFLFIGKAPATSSTNDDKFTNGYTTNTLSSAATVGDITITPGAIVPAEDINTSNSTTKNWKYQADALATYLTNIANAAGWSSTTNASLKSMYQQFTRTGTGVTTIYNAGSAESVRLLLLDLLNKIDGNPEATIVNAINSAIATKAEISGSGTSHTLAWKAETEFSGFPQNVGLPEGAAEYMWNATNSKFEYITDGTLSAVATAIENFIYPNELYYLTKTPLRATTNANVNWPATVDTWKSEAWTSWTNSVEATSKNIALKYNVNYGSALLASYVKAGASTLYDNARKLDPDKTGDASAKNNAIVVKDGETEKEPFELTGVLVGTQPSAVGWNFLPTTSATFTKVVYDAKMSNTIKVKTTDNTTPNYTLLFDDFRSSATDVNVCLEFKNNLTTSFYGKDGVILPGQTFYIIGKLNVTGATNPIPTDSTPNTDDELDTYYPNRNLRAFIQDYTTTANFVLTPGTADGDGGSLAKAVTTIPDLRQSSQTVGLSVDLTWKAGVTYNVNLGE